MNIYVGNLSFDTSDDDLRQLFESHGQISSVNIIRDKFSGQSRGFGFVEMSSDEEAEAVIEKLNAVELNGRTLNINRARPRPDRNNDRERDGSRGRTW